VKGDSTNEGEKEGYPLKKCYSTVIGLFNVKMVAYRHLLIITSTGDELLRNLQWFGAICVG